MKRVMLAALIGLLSAGCGSDNELARVSGQVTLDGRPLEGVVVQFQPVARGGSPSAGITDADGNYVLMFSLSEYGAEPGEHRVTIRTADCYYDEVDGAAAQESIPPEYNDNSQLRRTVVSQKNVFDFPLKSQH